MTFFTGKLSFKVILASLFGYFKNDCAAVRAIEGVRALNIGLGFIFFAVQSPLCGIGNAQGVIIRHQSRQGVHANGNVAYKLISGFESEGIANFICRAMAPDFFYRYYSFHVNLSP